MTLEKEYARMSDKEENKAGKTVLSDDAFAVCDFIERLNYKIELMRLSFGK